MVNRATVFNQQRIGFRAAASQETRPRGDRYPVDADGRGALAALARMAICLY
jgi:hypothetical protein